MTKKVLYKGNVIEMDAHWADDLVAKGKAEFSEDKEQKATKEPKATK